MESLVSNEINRKLLVQFVWDKFRKSVDIVKELPSYEDTNILLQLTTTGCSHEDVYRQRFVLKILFRVESDGNLMKKIECMNCLSFKHFMCSEFVRGIDGNYVQTVDEQASLIEGKSALLYSYLEGKELEYTGYVCYPAVIAELGSFVAHLHSALKDAPSKQDLVPSPDNPWSPNNYELLLSDNCMTVVEDTPLREMLTELLQYAVQTLNASKHSLTKDILHGDFHGLNVIVSHSYSASHRQRYSPFHQCLNPSQDKNSENVNTTSEFNSSSQVSSDQSSIKSLTKLAKVVLDPHTNTSSLSQELLDVYGVIDFDTMLYSYTSLEVGRLIADVMVTYIVQCQSGSTATSPSSTKEVFPSNSITSLPESARDHLLKMGGYVLAGYLSTKSLSDLDISCVFPSVLTSLCQYYLLGTKEASDQPNATAYVTYCSAEAMALLKFFHPLDKQDVVNTWLTLAQEILQSLKSSKT